MKVYENLLFETEIMVAYADRRFWLFHGLLPLCLFVILAGMLHLTEWDLRLSDLFYDFRLHLWPYKHSWWVSGLIHEKGKFVPVIAGGAALFVFGWSFVGPSVRSCRGSALFLCLAIGLSTGTVALGKATINRHCHWDYDRYGGEVPYTKLFEPTPRGCKPGHGFPAGYASGALSLMSSYFIFYGRNRRRALSGLAAGLLLGGVFGFGQLARGAHFVSHNIWSAAICWFVALFLYVAVFGMRLFPNLTPERQGDVL